MGALSFFPLVLNHACAHDCLDMTVTENRVPLFGDHT
jgi:hypothetical protein